MDKPTSEGERLVKNWLSEQEHLERCKSDLNRAQCDLANAKNALAKWILPNDAKKGEKIAIWYGDSLIQVEVENEFHDTTITVRVRGRHLHAA